MTYLLSRPTRRAGWHLDKFLNSAGGVSWGSTKVDTRISFSYVLACQEAEPRAVYFRPTKLPTKLSTKLSTELSTKLPTEFPTKLSAKLSTKMKTKLYTK